MGRAGHSLVRCECGLIIRQCRCPGPKTETVERPCRHSAINVPEGITKAEVDAARRVDSCPVCGAAMRDPELHREWHDDLERAARSYAPHPLGSRP